MRLLAGVLHSDEIVWNSYTWDADAHKQINTNGQKLAQKVDKKTDLLTNNINAIYWDTKNNNELFGIQLMDGTWKYFSPDK